MEEQGLHMSVDVGKVIGKTALKTTLIILVALIVCFAAFAGIFPGALSNIGDDIGSSYFAVVFSERQYQRTGDINDLGTLVERAIKYQNRDVTVTYSKELLTFEADGRKIFDEYAAFKDDQLSSYLGREYSYDDYINGNLAAALWQDKPSEAINYASVGRVYVTQNRYGSNNSMTYAVNAFLEYQTQTGFDLIVCQLEGVDRSGNMGRNKLAEMQAYYESCWTAAEGEGADAADRAALSQAASELKSLYSDLYRLYCSSKGDAQRAAQYKELYEQLG